MGTISARKRSDGTTAYTAQIRLKRDGKPAYSEAKTFDRKAAAAAWLKKRERELADPGVIEQASGPTLADAIDRYVDESVREIGRTKAQVLRSIKAYPIASMRCAAIKSADIIEFLRSLTGQPQTVGNYASHLAAVFAIARPMWDYQLDPDAMRDAAIVARRMGITSKSAQRDRRPTIGELEALLQHFVDRRKRAPQSMPMAKVILFALFSTRRQEEITRITWSDYEPHNSRVMVRDMKNPGEKIGNHVWVDLPAEAMLVIDSMPKTKPAIFPYSPDAITANFTRACKVLGIEDLRFHDLRHEGASRLFEMGMNIPQVAAVTGHRSWNSLKRYTHIRQSGDKYAGWPWVEKVTEK